MKKVIFLIIFIQFALLSHAQVIADHTVVDLYDDIPQRWIDSVKTKLVWAHGMSHGYGYLRGAELLEQMDASFQVDIWYHSDPPEPNNTAMRLGRPGFGRESHWTSEGGIYNFNTYDVARQNDKGNPYDFIWFGWSYQGTWENGLGGGEDLVHHVRWAGSTQSGTDGNKRWGLDSGDSILTENRVCMDTYLDAAEQFNQFYTDEGYQTKYFFSNGISDGNGGTELGFQRELKNQHIRDYMNQHGDENTYFLDYSDILVHNAAGELYTESWNDGGTSRPHHQIHPDNRLDYDENFNIIAPGTDVIEDHIGEVGAVRLAKAMWWLLARASGWDGNTSSSGIDVEDGSSSSEMKVYTESNFIVIRNIDSYIQGQIALYDMLGRLIEKKSIEEDESFFNVSSFSPGLYIIVASLGNDSSTEKVVLP